MPRSPCSTSEKRGRNHKHALDLIFSLSLASSCLAYTERAGMLSSARRKRLESNMTEGDGDPQYQNHLRVLLMDVIARSTEMDRQQDAMPWMQELQQLGFPEDGKFSVWVAGDCD